MLQSMLTNIDGNEGIYTPLPLRFSKGIVLQTRGRAYLTPVRERLADRVAQLCGFFFDLEMPTSLFLREGIF